MKTLIVNLCENEKSMHYDEFVLPVVNVVKKNSEFEVVHFMNLNEVEIEKYDKVILCGTALIDFSYLKNLDKFKWIKSYTKPILGICSGMQVVAKLFDCELIDSQEIGLFKISNSSPNALTIKPMFEVYNLHNKCVKLNSEFEILFENGEKVQGIKHKQKEIYGLIFHPEVRNHDLIENFLKIEK